MPLLYRYFEPDDITALRTMSLPASNPLYFNDPFEVRPCFDQDRHDYFAKSHDAFHAQLGVPQEVRKAYSMAGVPTENAVDFGEHLNKRFRDELGERFRVVYFSRTPSSALMWGHYTKSHQGFVLGLDIAVKGFATGIKSDGFEIRYTADRSIIKLPLAYYSGISIEEYDLVSRKIVNDPNQEVPSDGGLVIPFSEYWRQMEAARIAALTTKALDWAYEQEVRMIYDLSEHANQLQSESSRHFVALPPPALREIIFGFRTPVTIIQETLAMLKSGKIGHPQLFFSGCHPFRYEVQRHQAPPEYILQYYEIIRPTF
jgi:Protein of unknown function (DUF2971)